MTKDKAIAELVRIWNSPHLDLSLKAGLAEAIEALEPKTGEWIDYIGKDLGIDGQWLRDDGKTIFMQCDQCDSMVVRNLMTHKNYCPNCGARMKGGEEE